MICKREEGLGVNDKERREGKVRTIWDGRCHGNVEEGGRGRAYGRRRNK